MSVVRNLANMLRCHLLVLGWDLAHEVMAPSSISDSLDIADLPKHCRAGHCFGIWEPRQKINWSCNLYLTKTYEFDMSPVAVRPGW